MAPGQPAPLDVIPSALRVRGLERRYAGKSVVRGLDLDVKVGDLYGFLGPNGAGKTTAIRCMLGLIRKDAGEVEILGEANPVRQRAGVGSMVETPRFHEWLSGRANLQLACAYAGNASGVDEALTRVGLSERADDAVRGYSLGMKQRLGIARALVGSPKVLILDEPTNGLDPRGMREIRDLLMELVRRDRLTVFVSSHLLAEVEAMCNRVGIIDRGVLKAEGRVVDLLAGRGDVTEVEVGVSDRALALAVIDATDGRARIIGEGEDGRLLVGLTALDVSAFNQRLVEAGVGVTALVPRNRSLEDLFLEVTSVEDDLRRKS
ncbi:MAG: ABC transporter ATP-binding protein [Myxococcales bacterium]|nr:ABC transporter ATP-binding protein [Myxococcales bacterium]